jgi:lipid A 3-O-deacylase
MPFAQPQPFLHLIDRVLSATMTITHDQAMLSMIEGHASEEVGWFRVNHLLPAEEGRWGAVSEENIWKRVRVETTCARGQWIRAVYARVDLGVPWAAFFEEPLRKGTTEWGILAGYGLSNALGPSTKPGIDFITLMPRFGYVFAEIQANPPLKGSLEGVVEAVPALVAFEDSQTIYGGGFDLLLRCDFAMGTRVVPFLEGGAGILLSTPQSTDRQSQFRASQFNFTLQIAPGLRYFLNKRAALSLEYRFHHISDANTTEHNPGLNSDVVLLGFSIFQ